MEICNIILKDFNHWEDELIVRPYLEEMRMQNNVLTSWNKQSLFKKLHKTTTAYFMDEDPKCIIIFYRTIFFPIFIL